MLHLCDLQKFRSTNTVRFFVQLPWIWYTRWDWSTFSGVNVTILLTAIVSPVACCSKIFDNNKPFIHENICKSWKLRRLWGILTETKSARVSFHCSLVHSVSYLKCFSHTVMEQGRYYLTEMIIHKPRISNWTKVNCSQIFLSIEFLCVN